MKKIKYAIAGIAAVTLLAAAAATQFTGFNLAVHAPTHSVRIVSTDGIYIVTDPAVFSEFTNAIGAEVKKVMSKAKFQPR